MASLETKPPSPLTVFVKEEHETPAECSNAEFNCADSQPVDFKNEPETEHTLQQQEHLLKHQEDLLIYQEDQLLKHQQHSLNHQPEMNDPEFGEKSELTMKAHSSFKPFQCPICQKCFVKRSQLREHSLVHEATNFYCEVCHKEFTTTKSDFKIHIQQHYIRDNRGLFKCEHCPRYYANKIGLTRHYRVKHPPKSVVSMEENYYVVSDKEYCENSEQTEQVALVVREQQQIPDNKGPFKCKHCPKHYTHKRSLMRHCRMEHPTQKRLFSDTEFCEERKLTDLVASEKNESNKTESSIATVMSEEAIKKMVDNHKDNILLEFEISISDKGFGEEREENETTPECSNAEFNCADSQPVEFKNEPETEHTLQQEKHLLKHQEDLLIYQEDHSLKHLQHSLNHQPEMNHPPNSAVSDEELCEKSELTMKAHSRGKPFTCPTSQKYFVRRSQLRERHKVKSQEVNHVICKVCHKEFASMHKLARHMPQHIKGRKGPFKCEKCTEHFYSRFALLRHYEKQHPPKRIIDDSIKKTMKTRPPVKTFTCPTCQKCFVRKYHLRQHSLIHEATYFYCEVCHKEFTTTNSDFKSHMQQHYKPVSRGLFKCEHCSQCFSYKKYLMSHYRMEHPPKRAVSDEEFGENSELTERVDLVVHEKIPDIKGPFKCERCPKDYTHKRSLMRHCRMDHSPQKRVFSNKTESSIATDMSEEAIKKTVDDHKDNVLLESDIPISDEGFGEKRELSKLVASIKREASPETPYYVNVNMETSEDYILPELDMPDSDKEYCGESERDQLVSTVKYNAPSPESRYVNLEDDKFTVEELEVKTEEANEDY